MRIGRTQECLSADATNVTSSSSSSPNPKKQKRGPLLGESTNPNGAGNSNVLGLCLSSRRNMCIHDKVMEESDRELVDNACRQMTSSWVRTANEKKPNSVPTCEYYEGFSSEVRFVR